MPGSFDGADHDVRLADGSLAARAAGEVDHGDQVPPPPGDRAPGGGAGRDRLEHARRAARGDRGPRPPLRARRAVAPGGRPGLAADRLAGARGGRGAERRLTEPRSAAARSYARPRCAPVDRHPRGGVHGARRRVRGAAGAPPSEAPAARGDRHGGDGSVRAVRARPALAQARRRAWSCLQMWAYVATYQMPNDDPIALERRVRIDYPVRADRAIGRGVTPTLRLQRAFGRPGRINARRADADLVALDLVPRPARHGALRAAAPPRALPAQRVPALRDVRPRPDRLLGGPDGAAVVRGGAAAGWPTGARRSCGG